MHRVGGQGCEVGARSRARASVIKEEEGSAVCLWGSMASIWNSGWSVALALGRNLGPRTGLSLGS